MELRQRVGEGVDIWGKQDTKELHRLVVQEGSMDEVLLPHESPNQLYQDTYQFLEQINFLGQG